eukprot:5994158-Prymnesium_polylepis.1
MRRRRRVDRERLGVADVRDVREERERLDQLLAGLLAALDAHDHHRAALALEVLLLQLVHLVALEAGVLDPLHLRVRLEELGHRERVRAVLLHPQRQRLDALQEYPRVVRRDRRAQVAQRHRPHPQDERERRQHLGQVEAPPQTAVRRVRLRVQRVLARAPLERARVDDDAADARA